MNFKLIQREIDVMLISLIHEKHRKGDIATIRFLKSTSIVKVYMLKIFVKKNHDNFYQCLTSSKISKMHAFTIKP